MSVPRQAEAQTGTGLDVFPGDQSNGWAYMTCGWHDVCLWPYTGTSGLDWGNQDNWDVVWRSRGGRPGETWIIGSAWPIYWPTNCKNVDVDIIDNSGNPRGWVRYTHSDRPQLTWFYLWGDPNWYYQTVNVAKTVPYQDDLATCSTTGTHLHQTADPYWTRNAGAFPNAPTEQWRYVWDHPMHWTGW